MTWDVKRGNQGYVQYIYIYINIYTKGTKKIGLKLGDGTQLFDMYNILRRL